MTYNFYLALLISFLLLGVIILNVIPEKDEVIGDKTIKISGVNISSSQLNDIVHTVPNNYFILCHMDSGDCGLINKEKLNG